MTPEQLSEIEARLSPADIPALIAEVRKLQAELELTQRALGSISRLQNELNRFIAQEAQDAKISFR